MALAQFCKINSDRHFFTAIVKVNLFFIHFNDVGRVEFNPVDVFAAIWGCYCRRHGSSIDGLASGSIDDYDLRKFVKCNYFVVVILIVLLVYKFRCRHHRKIFSKNTVSEYLEH